MPDAIEHSTFRAALICSSRPDNTRCCVIMAATSRSDNAPHASRACAGAKLACGSSHDYYARTSSRLRGSAFTSRDIFATVSA